MPVVFRVHAVHDPQGVFLIPQGPLASPGAAFARCGEDAIAVVEFEPVHDAQPRAKAGAPPRDGVVRSPRETVAVLNGKRRRHTSVEPDLRLAVPERTRPSMKEMVIGRGVKAIWMPKRGRLVKVLTVRQPGVRKKGPASCRARLRRPRQARGGAIPHSRCAFHAAAGSSTTVTEAPTATPAALRCASSRRSQNRLERGTIAL